MLASGTMPRRTKTKPSLASAATIRRSNSIGTVSPAPTAAPLMAPITGVRIVQNAAAVGHRVGVDALRGVVGLVGLGAEHVGAAGHVDARAERPAGARDDDDPHRLVGVEQPHRLVELAVHRVVERVHRVGPVERERGHARRPRRPARSRTSYVRLGHRMASRSQVAVGEAGVAQLDLAGAEGGVGLRQGGDHLHVAGQHELGHAGLQELDQLGRVDRGPADGHDEDLDLVLAQLRGHGDRGALLHRRGAGTTSASTSNDEMFSPRRRMASFMRSTK